MLPLAVATGDSVVLIAVAYWLVSGQIASSLACVVPRLMAVMLAGVKFIAFHWVKVFSTATQWVLLE